MCKVVVVSFVISLNVIVVKLFSVISVHNVHVRISVWNQEVMSFSACHDIYWYGFANNITMEIVVYWPNSVTVQLFSVVCPMWLYNMLWCPWLIVGGCYYWVYKNLCNIDRPHDAICQSNSCQLLHNSVGTTCMTNPEQIEVVELEGYSRPTTCTL